MTTTERTFGLRAAEEPDIELEVFEEPIDRAFPRLPNLVSRRGHRALKIVVRVQGTRVIPPNATSVKIDVEVFAYGPDRIGTNRHIFRHRLLWGLETVCFELREGHEPEYEFEVIVPRRVGDDHLGEGPYEAAVKVTAQGEGLSDSSGARDESVAIFNPDPKVTIRFVAM
jgi:hypothetical protein